MVYRMAALALVAGLAFDGCNCGHAGIVNTESSLSLAAASIDFGAVPQGTSKTLTFHLDNTGRVAVNVQVALATGASPDFGLGQVPTVVEAGSSIEGQVTFTPSGPGDDTGALDITSSSTAAPLHVSLHGGPIESALTFDPDLLMFTGASTQTKTVSLRSTGTSALTITSLTVLNNPDFGLHPISVPVKLLPGEATSVQLDYTRRNGTAEGALEVSCDVDGGVRTLRLVPADEFDAGTDAGVDSGIDVGVDAGVDAGLDAGAPDAGVDGGVADAGPCSPDGVFHLDGGSIHYSCCLLVNVNIASFQLQSGGLTVTPTPTQPGSTLTSSSATTCPTGSFTATRVNAGGCSETYQLQGTFTSANTFVGTYTASFSGSDCSSPLCLGSNCTNQSWNVSASR